ncbi:MAG: choice-of-anchor L domain-containing protein [Polyangiaceae bacterium]|nr:choice-of-anchor L domain-containing protein [Polyangiaceae bacterium]
MVTATPRWRSAAMVGGSTLALLLSASCGSRGPLDLTPPPDGGSGTGSGGAATTDGGSGTGGSGTGGSGTGGSGTGGSGTGGSGTGGSGACGAGATSCGGVCTVLDFDPRNCGSCGNACDPGEVCSGGDCALACGGGTVECAGRCVDTGVDPAHCGGCGFQCTGGEVCAAGKCGLTCGGGLTPCAGSCVDTELDPAHCGGCGAACTGTQVCSGGGCGSSCTGGTSQCGALCVDVENDPRNCGGCGNACGPGEVCSAGDCGVSCSGGTTKCGTRCVDTELDPAHCGGCSQPCGPTQVCSAGACASVCGGGLERCGNECVDTSSDLRHCGACSAACGPGEKCVSGSCKPCDSATEDCDADGWLTADGDCCDKPGLCGADPRLVNPGALEVVGNGIDDDCNGKTDLFDPGTLPCDASLASDSAVPSDYANAIGICKQTTESPPLAERTWGLVSAELLRANGSALEDARARSIRTGFGGVTPATTQGSSVVVLSTGVAADATQTNPGPNGGAPASDNVNNQHAPSSNVSISTCSDAACIDDWLAAANPPLKQANQLPRAPGCGSGIFGQPSRARDSVMLRLRLRAPTNARAFSFNSYFLSAEYPEYVCSNFNDQFVALVDTPGGTPAPIPNPIDKNLLTYTQGGSQWPIGINVANGTNLFAVCEPESERPACWDTDVNAQSCSLGASQLAGTGFEHEPGGDGCLVGGGTHWLTTAGNVIPGAIVELRIVIWDVGDDEYDSTALIDGFQWLPEATLPGTK